MKHAGQTRLLTGLDGHAGASDRRGGGHAAHQRQQHIADALSDQLLVGAKVFVLHTGGGGAAQQAFDHTESGDGNHGRRQIGDHPDAQTGQT